MTLIKCFLHKCDKIVAEQEDKNEFDFLKLLQLLVDQEFPNLPPGGGLSAKQPFIEQVFREVCPSRADSISNDEKC
ncbi:hypothetical protein E2986_13390 [Frieseomelitta varia]|uniref:Protein serine/threonine phosphatase 2C C-terminal domain-containing protein n=1 Tax=Frieseomelitta varia TaxID=561572 RepID=A0A833S2Y4_9HYME|nr:hypothetical protein E2986_13390 [Frieseomelitta varia]